MKRILLLLALTTSTLATSTFTAHAQAPGDDLLPPGALPAPPATGAALNILQVSNDDVASLRTLGTGRRADAVSMGASLGQVRADAAAMQALAGWVRDGGVVFLHTDAAQLFGFETVPVRESTAQVAGQLFGRARNALPFGAHPLLWSGANPTAANTGLPTLAPSSRLLPELGVQVVYYQFDSGDALVTGHPTAIPLLRVTDMAATNAQPLYASAIAPFGNGWAVFSPRLVEQNRADGRSFAQNLLRLVRSVAPSPFDAPPLGTPAPPPRAGNNLVEPLVGIDSTFIEQLSQNTAAAGWTTLAAQWKKNQERIPSAFMQPADILKADTTQRLLVGKSEADAAGTALSAVAGGGDSTGLRALAALWRSRLEYQRGQTDLADQWLASAAKLAPDAAEVLLWRGVLTAAGGQNLLFASSERAGRFGTAAQDWTEALAAAPLVRTAAAGAAASLGGVPVDAIRAWITAATRAAQLMSAEPPLVSVVDNGLNGLVVRHFPDDSTLRLALPAALLLARADSFLGWRMDEEEILLFPTEQYYAGYSSVARSAREVAFNPLARRGNVVGNRILMVSQLTLPILVDPGPPPRYAEFGAAVPAVLGRLHAQVVTNTLTHDGNAAPAWMQLGLMSLSNFAIVANDPANEATPANLRRIASIGALLAPRQFENADLGNDRDGYVEAQARRLMRFFYARFGAGAVIETLQRLGSGESVDEALTATTGLTEAQFFVAWRDAEFGRAVPGG